MFAFKLQRILQAHSEHEDPYKGGQPHLHPMLADHHIPQPGQTERTRYHQAQR